MAVTPTPVPGAPPPRRRPLRRLPWRAGAELTGVGLLVVVVELVLGTGGSGFGPAPETKVLLGAAALVPMALRRRFPTGSLLGSAVLLGLLPGAGLPAAVVAYSTARRIAEPRRRALLLSAASALAVTTGTLAMPLLGYGGAALGCAVGAVLAATTLVLPGLLGGTGGQEDRLLRALRDRADAAEANRRLAESEARTEERSRIAAEMHDLLGHRLSVVSLHAGGLEMAMGEREPELREEAALVRRSVGEAMRELRELLGVLGPLEPDGGPAAATGATGTRADLDALAGESVAAGVPVTVEWEGPDLDGRPARVRHAVHRVVREGLTNVHRYAPGAEVAVLVEHTGERVVVRVLNGPPSAPPQAATGLGTGRGHIGLRERLALLGGELAVGPAPGGGYALTATMPTAPGPAAARSADAPSAAAGGRAATPPGRRTVRVLTGVVGLLGVGVTMLGGVALVGLALSDSDPLPAQPEPAPGMDRAALIAAVYGDDPAARAAAAGREPDRPAAVTECLYSTYPPAPQPEPGRLLITRYCLRDGVLTAIDPFTVPLAASVPPRETP
ncbi:histidine kinase [Kitasatospora sp. NPDC096147]|uniref:ATP-binding protein n=1 Tax=Kitasatospora sp. NPDC096147 TaxID=3364093 RepID=UPI003810E16C